MKLFKHQNIYGMSRVGTFKNKGTTYEVYINTDDGGMIPHFHLRDKINWDEFHTCIKIEYAEYFLHEGKEDKLTSKQKQLLQEFMIKDVELQRYKGKFKNNWELICFLWDMNNSSVNIDENINQPNYINLK